MQEAEQRSPPDRVLNKNAIPFGSAAAERCQRDPGRGVTTQGMGVSQMKEVAALIPGGANRGGRSGARGVDALVREFPAYPAG